MNAEPQPLFDEDMASVYDQCAAKLAPFKDALHFCIAGLLSDLPREAHLLIVGAGTGAELHYLAQTQPQWRFTAVEPAPAMMAICRQRCEEQGFTDRCVLHEGYLESLPLGETFDAATSILVSQFVVDPHARQSFFEQIATRLKPNGTLISADLARDPTSPQGQELMQRWSRMQTGGESTSKSLPQARQARQASQAVAVWPPKQISDTIASAGFHTPLLFFQTLMIHGWVAQRTT